MKEWFAILGGMPKPGIRDAGHKSPDIRMFLPNWKAPTLNRLTPQAMVSSYAAAGVVLDSVIALDRHTIRTE